MPMYDANDAIEKKNREKRKKRLVRFAVFLIILVIGTVIFLTQELWLPKLRGIGKQYTTIVNDGSLAQGNFPIEVSGGGTYQLDCSDNMLFVLCDSSIYIYSNEGGLIKHRQHAYTNAVMNVVNGRSLIYESGGSRFSVEDRNDVLYSKELEENIMFVRLSAEGYTAVVTTSADYDCEINVFDRDGKFIYERKCVERVNDISFIEDSMGCVISYIYAENGSLVTSVQETLFTESSENWTSPGLDTLGVEVCGFGNGAAVIGIDACGYVDENGKISSLYRYDGEFAGGACENGKTAVIINSDDTRKYVMTLFDGIGKEPLEMNFDSPLIDVTVSEGLAYVMTKNSVLAYDFEGSLRSTAQVNDSYTGFVRSGRYVFLKSFNGIDRINYES